MQRTDAEVSRMICYLVQSLRTPQCASRQQIKTRFTVVACLYFGGYFLRQTNLYLLKTRAFTEESYVCSPQSPGNRRSLRPPASICSAAITRAHLCLSFRHRYLKKISFFSSFLVNELTCIYLAEKWHDRRETRMLGVVLPFVAIFT